MKTRRLPFLDEYVEDGESAVLIDERVMVLSPLATTILAAADGGWVDVEEVAEALLAAFGPPPDGADLLSTTESAVLELAAQGLVETSGDTR